MRCTLTRCDINEKSLININHILLLTMDYIQSATEILGFVNPNLAM